MLCDKCKNKPAVIHIKRIVNGTVYEKHLCEECGAAESVGHSFENPFTHFLDSFFEAPAIKTDVKKCPECKRTLNDILTTGRVGCAECYTAFEKELAPYIKQLQGADKYIGSKTAKTPNESAQTNKTDDLPALQRRKV